MFGTATVGTALWLFAGCVTVGVWSARRMRSRLEFRAELLDQLALAARHHLPLHTGLAWAAEEVEGSRRTALLAAEAELARGVPTAEALRTAAPDVFPEHVLAAVRAADGSPRLATTLEAGAIEGREAARFVHRAWLALAYPLLLVLGVSLAGGRMIVRHLGEMLEAMGIHSPAFALADDAAGTAAIGAGVAALLLLVAASWPAIARLLGRRAIDVRAVFLHVPVVGGLIRLDAGARVLGALAAFAAAGEPLDIALEEVADAAGDHDSAGRVREAARRAGRGEPAAHVWEAMPVPEAARVRGAVACTRAAPLFAENLAALSRDCRVIWRARLDRLTALAQPAALLVVGALLALQYGAVVMATQAVGKGLELW